MSRSVEDGFKKVSPKRVLSEKLNRQAWRTHEWPQVPRQLSAQEEIASQPGNKDFSRHDRAAA